MAAEAMLNKNRMMVFKNKGKDQEVSESLLLPRREVIEFLASWILFARASRRSRVRRPARYRFPSPPPPDLMRACVYANCTCELCFLPDFYPFSSFISHLFLSFFVSIIFFSFPSSVFLPLPLNPFIFLSLPLLFFFFLIYFLVYLFLP